MSNECFGYRKSNGRAISGTMKVFGTKTWGRLTLSKSGITSATTWTLQMSDTDTIVSPFAPGEGEAASSSDRGDDEDDELELTRDNVELVLDEMRPFLKADG